LTKVKEEFEKMKLELEQSKNELAESKNSLEQSQLKLQQEKQSKEETVALKNKKQQKIEKLRDKRKKDRYALNSKIAANVVKIGAVTGLLEIALKCVEGDSPLNREELRVDREFQISKGIPLSKKRQKQWDAFEAEEQKENM